MILVILSVSVTPALAQEGINNNLDLTILWDQVHQQPGDFGVGCVPLANRSGTILYNADEAFPLASISKLLILIEYARRVDIGVIRTDEVVSLAALNLYNLPRSNRGAHEEFLAQYPDDTQTISLWEVATIGMIQYSSNAASDYLLDRLSPVDWQMLYQMLRVTNTDYPHSLTAISLLMDNHETGQASMSDVSSLSVVQGEIWLDRYVQDAEWRQNEIGYRTNPRRPFPAWNVQAAILQQHTATGTVRDFLNIMAAIYDVGGPLSANAKQMMRTALRWTGYEVIDNTYVAYGSKLGFYSGGMLALVAYGNPYAGNPVISVSFLRNISRRNYNQLLRDDSIGNLAHWMNLNGCAGLVAAIEAGN